MYDPFECLLAEKTTSGRSHVTADKTVPAKSRLCSVVSKKAGDDPGGSGTPFDAYLGVEIPPPWADDIAESRRFPEGLVDPLERAWDAGIIGKFTGLMPAPEYSVEGRARVLLFEKPQGPLAAYERREWLLPSEQLVPFAEALADTDDLSRFDRYREEGAGVRDVLVCTHGAHDACCGKFGYPVYEELRSEHAGPDLRVWRTSHIGGHRFAPTLLDFPEGRYWGHVETEHLEGLARRSVPAAQLARFCRGWAAVGRPFEQLVEREVLAREGWEWTTYLRSARTLSQRGEERAEVLIEYASPDGAVSGAYEATVEQDGSVMTLGSSGTDPLQEVERYRVSRLEKLILFS